MLARLRVVLVVFIALLIVAYIGLRVTARPVADHPFFNADDGVLAIAHQGGDRLWPSNTLYAFERATDLGADVLELDVHATSDGELVVIHDDTLERTTDGEGLVRETTSAAIKALDAGYDWSPERTGKSFPYRGQGIEVPTLAEVFEAFPDSRINLEIKQLEPDIAAPLCELIQAYGKEATVLVGSFHDAALRTFRERCPSVATSAGPSEVRTFFILNVLFLGDLYQPPAEALQVPEYQGRLRIVTRRFVRAAARKNMEVHVWTVDEAEAMERLIDLGVDGIITDRPDRLLRVLGRPNEAERPEGVPE